MSEKKDGFEEPPEENPTEALEVEPLGYFDGTAQSVARARLAAAYQRQRAAAGVQSSPQLTRESIANAQKAQTPVARAQEGLDAAVKAAGSMSVDAACAELGRVIGEAYTAGVDPRQPSMRRAAALLTTLEAQAKEVQKPKDELETKLDALFGGGFAMPETDLERLEGPGGPAAR